MEQREGQQVSRKKTTHEDFLKQFNQVSNSKYELLNHYINRKTKIKVKCLKCGNITEMTPGNFLRGRKCRKCFANSSRKTTQQFKNEVKAATGNEYSVIGEYETALKDIEIRHNTCGKTFKMRPSMFLYGQRCPHCQHRSYKKTTDEFKNEIRKIVGSEYCVIGEYSTNMTKIKMKHNVCETEYEVTPLSFLQGNRCPYCYMSNEEKTTYKILKKLGLTFERQYSFEDLRYKKKLKFDFAVFNNKMLYCLIECDGSQHFEPMFNDTEEFDKTVIRDNLKNQYCIAHNIKLIRIPYYIKDKETYLKHFLKEVI